MPSSHRTQVLLPDYIQPRVERLATKQKRSMSAMCCELIEYALTHGEEYQDNQADSDEAGSKGIEERMERMEKMLAQMAAMMASKG